MIRPNPFKPDMCVYHADCMDGFTAAYLVWKQFPDIEFVGAHHGTLPSVDVTGRSILMVDFAPKLRDMPFWQRAKQLVIIDHHKSAEEDLKDVPRFLLNEVPMDAPISAFFDMRWSGAGLTWLYFHDVGKPMPMFVELVQDRDLWKFHYEESKPFSVALSLEPKTFELYDGLFSQSGIDYLVTRGKVMQQYHDSVVQKLSEEVLFAAFHLIGGIGTPLTLYAPLVNAPYQFASDLANHLLTVYPDAPFGATWFRNGRGQYQFSLRSDDSREDVSAIARQFGGGGHRNAAGFELNASATDFVDIVSPLVARH